MKEKRLTRIALLGCGGIGSRHLEALRRLPAPLELFVVEPDPGRRRAAEEGGALAGGEPVRCLAGVDDLPREVDVALVATAAGQRRGALEGLLHRCRPSFLVLEKVLFQRREDFAAVDRLLAAAGIPCWVNCPRRLWPQYRSLAEEIAPCPELLLRVVGPPSIGPGSNAIHFLDLFAFLTGSDEITVEADRLDLDPRGGKRGGVEFFGTLTAHTPAGGTLLYSTLRSGDHPVRLNLDTGALSLEFEEGTGRASRASAENGWRREVLAAPPVFQSRLTDLVVQDLLARGECGLSTYAQSARLHLPLLRALDHRLRELGVDTRDGVPVT